MEKEKERSALEYWDSTGDWRKKYYSEIRNSNSNERSYIEQKEYELDCAEYFSIRMFLESKKVSRVLDIGCGVGRQLLDFGLEFPGIYFEGIDIAPYQIELFDSEIRNRNAKNIKAIVMNAANIIDLNEQYDMIISCNNSLGCMQNEDRRRCLSDIYRVLGNDGIFLMGNFERFDIVDKCYTEWGMNLVKIDFENRIVDLGHYKSRWLSNEMLIEELKTYGMRCFYKFTAGLGSVYVFNKRRGGFKDETL